MAFSHPLQHQSSTVSSCASMQTVILMQNLQQEPTSTTTAGYYPGMQTSMSYPLTGLVGATSTVLSQSFTESIASSKSENTSMLTVADVADLLHPQYAIITGARTQDGCPFLTFPDRNNFQSLSEDDYQKLIYYLTSVPS